MTCSATCVNTSTVCSVPKLVGNLEPIGFQLMDNNCDPVDISGQSFWFEMINIDTGIDYLIDGVIVVDDAPTGRVSWHPREGETDDEGTYAGYVMQTNCVDACGVWPYERRKLLIVIDEM